MGRKITIAAGALVTLSLAAGGFYWMRARGEQALPLPDVVSPEPPGFKEAVLGDSQAAPTPAKPATKTKAKKKALPAEAALPLKTGEVLNYTADVAKLDNVATLTLKVAGQGSFLGKSVWHLQAAAHTLKPLRVVFELDDQFDSYSDARTLESLQYEMRLNERGQKVQSIQRMTPTGRDPAKAGTTEARVVPGTRDPLGMMQYLRTVDWKETSEASSPVYDGHKLYEVRAKLASASVAVGVPAGDYRATKIEIHVFENGVESKDASFALYLANDAGRTPVLLEAVMPIATARVALVKEEQQSHDARR
ncbi:MAG TPA: DUF3108 domain-containing protein [Candidatus Acidoferrum sp.]|jgi:hypothetical protein|nr:DUF3108 domain-containing protein [Candidatus Acidoferrum sp.]